MADKKDRKTYAERVSKPRRTTPRSGKNPTREPSRRGVRAEAKRIVALGMRQLTEARQRASRNRRKLARAAVRALAMMADAEARRTETQEADHE